MLGRYIQLTCLAARGPSDSVEVKVEVGVGVVVGLGVEFIAATRKLTAPPVLYVQQEGLVFCLFI